MHCLYFFCSIRRIERYIYSFLKRAFLHALSKSPHEAPSYLKIRKGCAEHDYIFIFKLLVKRINSYMIRLHFLQQDNCLPLTTGYAEGILQRSVRSNAICGNTFNGKSQIRINCVIRNTTHCFNCSCLRYLGEEFLISLILIQF